MKPAKAYLNVLRLRLNMALGRRVVSNYPVFATIEPTSFCNLRCPLCPTGLRLGLRPPKAMDWDLWKCIIDDIGDYLFRLDMFNWGEPLLHKETPELIQYAKSKGIMVVLSSNLSMKLTDEYVQRLVRSGLDRLIVSLDGVTQETYEKYRRGGDISLVRENMLRIQAAKGILCAKTLTVVWQFLVFRHNEHEVETARREYKNWGADKIVVDGALTSCEYGDIEASSFEPSTIAQYNRTTKESRYSYKSKRRLPKNCPWLYGAFVLNPDGRVSPCCAVYDQKDDFAVYSPYEGFFPAWNSEKFQKARGLFSKSKGHKDSVAVEDPQTSTCQGHLTLNSPEAVGREEQLICRRCPMLQLPSSFYAVEDHIFKHALELGRRCLLKRSVRDLFALEVLLIVAGPRLWQRVAWGAATILKRRVFRLLRVRSSAAAFLRDTERSSL